jgi:ribulose-phosphate 3-epimerase
MYQQPINELNQLVQLKPHLVVIHHEAEGDHIAFATQLQAAGIKAGLAILQDTPVAAILELLKSFDYVLVFSGDLGHHGGQADLSLLDKVRQIRNNFPALEISWDGGINDQNAKQLVEAGVNVLNVGGFIQKAEDPRESYQKLTKALQA